MSDTSAKPVVLVVDDEKNTREGLGRALRRDYDVVLAESAAAALKALDERPADVMLSDVRMPGEDGLALLRQVREKHPATVCILLTAYGTVETAVEAMKLGAQNFLTKPVNLDQLDLVLERALRARDLERENRDLKRRLDARYGLENIVGSSPAMERLFDVIRQAAPTQATVLIEGASGTGKELVAQAIHHLSPRASGPFVAVHCAALYGGTLFLDEIGEIDASVQVKLLRVLETRQFERVGGTETLTADIRVVAATNRDLAAEVKAGRFREDLFYRLNVVDIRMPTLAERTGDIPMLCDRFVKEFAPANGRTVAGFEPAAMAVLQAYPWPGNVRELRNTVEKMVVLSRGELLTVQDVPANIRDGAETAARVSPEPVPTESLAQAEKRKILAALEAAGGNRSRAADALGISRRTLHRKLAAWGVPGRHAP